MRHKWVVIVWAVIGVMTGLPASGQETLPRELVQSLRESTVLILIKVNGKVAGNGTGFVFGDRMVENQRHLLIMTNKHVAAPEEIPAEKVTLGVVFRSGTAQEVEVPGTVIAADPRELRDLAVVDVVAIPNPPAPIQIQDPVIENELAPLQPLFCFGFPLTDATKAMVEAKSNPECNVTRLEIARNVRDDSKQIARIQLNGNMIEGNSGGPIVDAKGRLIGVAQSRWRGNAVGFAVPPNVIMAFLDGDIGVPRGELLAVESNQALIRFTMSLVDPLFQLRRVVLRYAAGGVEPGKEGTSPVQPISDGTDVEIPLAPGQITTQISLPLPDPKKRDMTVQFIVTDAKGRTRISRPITSTLPEKPGRMDTENALIARAWSCELNQIEGSSIQNTPGTTTIHLPGGKPLVLSSKFKLYEAPSALVQVEGDFQTSVVVDAEFNPGSERVTLPNGKKAPSTYQGAGLLIWQDEGNYILLERYKHTGDGPQIEHEVGVQVYQNGKELGFHIVRNVPDAAVILACRRKGDTFEFLYAMSPGVLVAFKELALSFRKDLLVGISASNVSQNEFDARFSRFRLTTANGEDIPVKPDTLERKYLVEPPGEKLADGTWRFDGVNLRFAGSGSKPEVRKRFDLDKKSFSGGRALIWSARQRGEAITLEFPVDEPGQYELRGKFSLGPDHGRVTIAVDGRSVKGGNNQPADFYYKEFVAAKAMPLTTQEFKKGVHKVTITMRDKNANSAGMVFGIDELLLVPVNPAKATSASAKR